MAQKDVTGNSPSAKRYHETEQAVAAYPEAIHWEDAEILR
jgi:hypothetical protein